MEEEAAAAAEEAKKKIKQFEKELQSIILPNETKSDLALQLMWNDPASEARAFPEDGRINGTFDINFDMVEDLIMEGGMIARGHQKRDILSVLPWIIYNVFSTYFEFRGNEHQNACVDDTHRIASSPLISDPIANLVTFTADDQDTAIIELTEQDLENALRDTFTVCFLISSM